ncbi:MAG: glycosyltransferase family 4 protein [Clostridia bacterium]|nr:glycosyltransferase family 4 protein [Clostridia bacterium]
MNLLFLEGDMSRSGGTERMTAWLSGQLCKNHTVHILSLRMAKEEVFYPLQDTITHKCLQNAKTTGKICEIRRYIHINKIDVMINVDTGMGYIGILAAAGTKAKVITWEHSNFYNNWNSRWFPMFRKFAARYSDVMAVLTERDKRNYETNIRGCVPVKVLPNPASRHQNTYDIESKIILSAGLLGKIKRFDLLVPIGKIVFSRHPDWQWFLCGDGPEREVLENAVQEAGLSDHICFCGSVKDMESMYRRASIYVLTSEMEGLPMVLLEAKSYGLPIISFDIETGPSDIVRDGVNGYLVKSGDTDEMAERICGLIEEDALRKKFSDAAELDMEKFDEGRILELWEQLIQSL